MSRNSSTQNYGGFAGIVNGLAVLAVIVLIGSGYMTAIGSFAGVA